MSLTKNRMKNIVMVIALTLLMINPVYALQQTSGALSINITQDDIAQGFQGFAKYGLRNEENQTVTVKLSANGSIADYVNITTNLSSNYNGSRKLDGIGL